MVGSRWLKRVWLTVGVSRMRDGFWHACRNISNHPDPGGRRRRQGERFDGNDRDVDRATTVEIKDIGSTKMEASKDEKKKES